jgi:hypothetical protein
MDQETLHKALLKPEAFPDARGPVEFRETHASRLYFVDNQVFKVKKPVDFGFLDFTSLDRRRFFCHEEVRLNRRLCPEIYLGVAEIRRTGNRIAVNGPGIVIDYAVVMRQLPEDRLLSGMLTRNDPSLPGKMTTLAHRIAAFHESREVFRSKPGHSHLEVILSNWQENFSQTAPFIDRTIPRKAFDFMRGWVEQFLQDRKSLLLQREAEGFVRDGHGDLHCEHICFTEPICIYDCIEFNRRFRIADILADLAFLLMDLEFRNRRDLAAIILTAYLGKNGRTQNLEQLLDFYKIYRAWVRGKVESFLSEAPAAGNRTRSEAAARATRYFNLALGYLCRPTLMATCGLMGTGKTTIGEALAQSTGGELLRSDVLRKEIAGLSPDTKQPVEYGQGIYGSHFSDQTYALLQERALAVLAKGRTVIADASFARRRQRENFRQAAEGSGVPFLLLHVTCDQETALARLDLRLSRGKDASDGRRELYDRQKREFESPGAEEEVFRLDTEKPREKNVADILCILLERFGSRTRPT